MNMAPIEGGDQPIRRLDTQVVNLIEDTLSKMNQDNYKEMSGIISRILDLQKAGGENDEKEN